MRTQLLCTFTRKSKLNEIVDIIVSCNDILYDKIYVFENQDEESQLIKQYRKQLLDGEHIFIDMIKVFHQLFNV